MVVIQRAKMSPHTKHILIMILIATLVLGTAGTVIWRVLKFNEDAKKQVADYYTTTTSV